MPQDNFVGTKEAIKIPALASTQLSHVLTLLQSFQKEVGLSLQVCLM